MDEGTKISGLGGVTFGLLLILFARFVPFGAVGTMRMWRSRVVVVVPQVSATAGGVPSEELLGEEGAMSAEQAATNIDPAEPPDVADQ